MLEKIPVVLLFIITLVVGLGGPYARKHFLNTSYSKQSHNILMTFGMMLFTMIYFLIFSGFKIEASKTSILLGLAYGSITVIYILFQTIATNTGPLSYTTVIISLSTVVTALSGAIFYGEKLSALKIIGIVLMVFCLILAVDNSKDKDTKKSKLWFIMSILTFLFCAFVGLVQKAHQESNAKEEIMGFLFYSFVFASILSLIAYLITYLLEKKNVIKNNEDLMNGKYQGKKFLISFIIYSIISGLSYGAVNQINLYLIGVIDSAIFFPIVNGGNLILVAIISFIVFKERLSTKQLIGLILGAFAGVLLCI